jgi:hypothetical protein
LNFFGYLDQKDMNFFATALKNSVLNRHNHTFGMTHYPTGTLLFGKTKEGIDFWDISHHISLWFSGHLHTLAGGIGDKMHAYQHESLLELELGDLKIHGLYRIVVVDHDLISFRDISLHSPDGLPMKYVPHGISRPPIVLVTNPKDSRYIIPNREPIHLIKSSTHIRVLIWSANPISKVQLWIDGVYISEDWSYHGTGKSWSSIENLNEQDLYIPLWTIGWDPKQFSDNQPHIMVVSAMDSVGLQDNHTVLFRTDGVVENMNAGIGGFIISLKLGQIFKELFLIGYFITTIGLLLIPKGFVMVTRHYGDYPKWKEDTSRELIARDKARCAYLNKNNISLQEWLQFIRSDFVFTMKGKYWN